MRVSELIRTLLSAATLLLPWLPNVPTALPGENPCVDPAATDDWLAYHWRLGYTQRERIATRLERAIAATARLLRTRLWGRADERGAQ